MPGVRRVMADNPGPFTFKGTISYIIGTGRVAIIDPGPDDPRHIAALLDAVRNETVTHIFVTHTHRDHSPAVPAIKAATGATVYAEGPHRAAGRFTPASKIVWKPAPTAISVLDIALKDGEVVAFADGWSIEAVTTPGHTANHMAYAFRENNTLFAGDHVMGWATTIVAPPDGDMSDYMASPTQARQTEVKNLFLRSRSGNRTPLRFVTDYILHRKAREDSILHWIAKGPTRHSDDRACKLYRSRSSLARRRRSIGAGASGRSCRAGRGGDRRPSGNRRHLPSGRWPLVTLTEASCRLSAFRLRCCAYGVVDARPVARARAMRRHRNRERPIARSRAHFIDARPVAERLTRTTTSSRNPMIGVRAVASMAPSRRGCGGRASAICHLRLVTTASADIIGLPSAAAALLLQMSFDFRIGRVRWRAANTTPG